MAPAREQVRVVTRLQGGIERKAPVERILDRWAIAYTPAALVLAGVLWALIGDPVRAITMLIVFCPCVMVLATPTALVASIGNAALRGSLVKRGAVIEALAAVDCVVFDKTGTLTEGRPQVADVAALDGLRRRAAAPRGRRRAALRAPARPRDHRRRAHPPAHAPRRSTPGAA